MAPEAIHEFGPNNGRLIAWAGLVATGFVVVSVLGNGVEQADAAVLTWCALVAVFLWCMFLRPKIIVEGSVLRLRNGFSDVRIPLVRVQYAAVTMFTNVVTDERTFRSTAVTRTRKQNVQRGTSEPDPMNSLADLVETTLNQVIDDAKAQRQPEGEITRAPAVVELALLAGLLVLSVVLVLVVG
ncbi:MAG TPA: hypothetical protein VIR30_11875 [Nocardioides sp.]